MPAIPTPVFIFKFVMKNIDGYFSCTRYYNITGGSTFTQAQVATVTNHVSDVLGAKFIGLLSEDAQVVHVYGRLRTPTQDMEHYCTSGSGIGIGAISGQSLPTETCLEIQMRTGKPGRNMRGRIFVSGISEEGSNAGLLVPGSDTLTGAQALATALGIDITSAPFTLNARHWNRKTNTLEVVTQCRPVFPLVSRRDRRGQKNLQPF